MNRLVVLDTETTGLDPAQGHRVIEIGCVELLGRRPSGQTWHHYINPQRAIDSGAAEVHGIRDEDLCDKPVFAALAEDFLRFVEGAEVVIHNAAFDVGFLDAELAKLDGPRRSMRDFCQITDSLVLARERYPGQRNSLDALCKRLGVDNSSRQLHGALLDAQLLAEVYLGLTVGQDSLELAVDRTPDKPELLVESVQGQNVVLHANADELAAHQACLDELDKVCAEGSIWRRSPDD